MHLLDLPTEQTNKKLLGPDSFTCELNQTFKKEKQTNKMTTLMNTYIK